MPILFRRRWRRWRRITKIRVGSLIGIVVHWLRRFYLPRILSWIAIHKYLSHSMPYSTAISSVFGCIECFPCQRDTIHFQFSVAMYITQPSSVSNYPRTMQGGLPKPELLYR